MIIIENILDLWGAGIWRASWQGALLAVLVWVLLRIVPSIPARFQCWLWRLVMLKFLISLVWAAPVELSLLPAAERIAPMASVPTRDAPISIETIPLSEYPSLRLAQPLFVAFVFWVVAVLWQLARLALACRNACQLKSRCRLIENRQILNVLTNFSNMAGLSAPPLVLETEGQGSPLLVGFLRPAIVLPAITTSRLSISELRLVMSHELAHVVRRDLFFSLMAAIIRAVFFFHPLAWFGERQVGLAQEMAADELAMELQNQDPAKYASMLISVVSKLGPRKMVSMMSLEAMGPNSSLKQRLVAMRFIKSVPARIAIVYCFLIGGIAVPCLVPCSIVAAEATASEQTESKETTIDGKFVSFRDGTLKIIVLDDRSEVAKEYEWKVADETKIVSHIRGTAQEGIARDAFRLWESGAIIAVKLIDQKVTFVDLGSKVSSERVREKTPDRVRQTAKTEWGRFVSYEDGLLTMKSNADNLLKNRISENDKILVWNDAESAYKPAISAAVLKDVKVGAWVVVNVSKENATIRIGAKKGSTTGTLVAYKDGRLLILGKDLDENFTKKYGNRLHFNKFREDVAAYESVDGGEYQLIGTANKVLGNVKEGTVITIHAEGDDNITLLQIGLPRK